MFRLFHFLRENNFNAGKLLRFICKNCLNILSYSILRK